LSISILFIADDFLGSHPGRTVRYNDVSLPQGGIFDLDANWRAPKGQGHASHACGADAGVRITDANGVRLTGKDIKDLSDIIIKGHFGAFMIREDEGRGNNHLHIHFEDCP
jgi:hypothetical protein